MLFVCGEMCIFAAEITELLLNPTKTMMPTIRHMQNWGAMALFLMAATFTACSTDDTATTPTTTTPGDAPQTYTLTVKATKEDMTRALTLGTDGETGFAKLNASWVADEEVAVLKYVSTDLDKGYWTQVGKLKAENVSTDGLTCNLTGSIPTAEVNHNHDNKLRLVYPYQSSGDSYTIFYDSQDGTLETVSSSYDYCYTLEPVIVKANDGTTLYTQGTAVFTNNQAIVRFNLKDKDGNALNSEDLTISVKDNDNNECLQLTQRLTGNQKNPDPDYMFVYRSESTAPYYVALPGFENKTITLKASPYNDYPYSKSDVTIVNGNFYDIEVRMDVVKPINQLKANNIGWIIGSDGNAYSKKELVPSSVTARAVTGYSESSILYAFALEDVKDNNVAVTRPWDDSLTELFEQLNDPNTASWAIEGMSDPWTLIGFVIWYKFLQENYGNQILTDAGGEAMSGEYWTSDTYTEEAIYINGSDGSFDKASKSESKKIRPAIAIEIDDP